MKSSIDSPTITTYANYRIIIPLSLAGVLIAVTVSLFILALVSMTKRLHTVTYLLLCNGSIASIFYSIIQSINYIFLAFVPSTSNDFSCRIRAYFGYMSISAVVYSYLAQAISRLFVSIYSSRYRWANAWKTHQIVIFIQWFIVFLLPTPALLTKDISHRPFDLCWVPRDYTLHVIYTALAYYLIPTLFILITYIIIFFRIKHRRWTVFTVYSRRRVSRDLEVLYTIMIPFTIYTVGAIPTLLFFLTGVRVLYGIGIVSVSVTFALEKIATLLLDRDMRNLIHLFLSRSMTQVRPIS